MKFKFIYSILLWLPLIIVLYSGINLLDKPYGLDGILTLSHSNVDNNGTLEIDLKNLDTILSVSKSYVVDVGILYGDNRYISVEQIKAALISDSLSQAFLKYTDKLQSKAASGKQPPPSKYCRIVSYNGVNWQDKLRNVQKIKGVNTKLADNAVRNELSVIYAGKPFVLHVSCWSISPFALLYNVLPTVAALFLALAFSLLAFQCDKTRVRYIYLASYIVTTGVVFSKIFFISGAMAFSSIDAVKLFNWQLIAFFIPLVRFFHSKWKWLWGALLAFSIITALSYVGGPRIILLATVVYLALKEKGVNRRYYRFSLYLLFYWVIVFLLALPGAGSPFLNHNGKSLFTVLDSYLIVTDALIDSLFLTVFYIVFMDVYFRLIRAKLVYLEVATIVFIFGMSTLLIAKYLVTALLLNSRPDFLEHINPILSLTIAGVVSLWFLRLYPIAYPVSLKLHKIKERFLAESYTYKDSTLYVEFMLRYFKLLIHQNSMGKLAAWFNLGVSRIQNTGANSHSLAFFTSPLAPNSGCWASFDGEEIKRIWQHLQGTGERLNIDIEILNNTEIGKRYSYYDSPDYPHLFFPVFDHQKQLIGILALGKSRGVYWHDKLAAVLEDIFDIFRSLYLNQRTQEELLSQSISLAREQEARAYVEQLEQVTREKNTILVEERERMIQSMEYAALIQKSMLPQPADLKQNLQGHFLVWKPRDIVGGDLYWHYTSVDPAFTYLAVIDCTGHGVPGALLTMTANSLLLGIIKDKKIYSPGEILTQLHIEVSLALNQTRISTRQDGLEISLIRIDRHSRSFIYSGAGLDILVYDGNNTELLKGERFGIGGGRWHDELLFGEQSGTYNETSIIYMFSDGVVDQPNPSRGNRRRLGLDAWQDWVDSITGLKLADQRVALEQFLTELLQYHEQRDDITVLGFIPGGGGIGMPNSGLA